ncbi:filamentous hemagglutinin [Nostoc sp. MBR 210]|nr:filamentous hemagglutinin [Nostoc sp. MBR 210]
MKFHFVGFGFLGVICIWAVCNNGVYAQVSPDHTLNTAVDSSSNSYTIKDGTRVGNNLFHSFSQFSILQGVTASFDNATDIQNIFSRVTGGEMSKIDGQISTKGNANLFLLNPAGIIFGKNASLSIDGSFVATTANSIKFADGKEFSTNTNTSPLLTMSVPVGLQMGSNAGAITVQGTPANNPLFRTPTLSVKANQTLALIGGQIDVDSANISAPDGHVELWAIRNGMVNIPASGNWQLASSSLSPTWGTITLRQSSSIDTSGANGGAINIRGQGLTLQEGSNIGSATGTNGQGQGITVQTTEFVNLLGASHPGNVVFPGLNTSVRGSMATAGNITVETPRLQLDNGGWLSSVNFATNSSALSSQTIRNSKTGNIMVRATEIDVRGYTPFINPATRAVVSSAITTLSGGTQNDSGAITVEAERIRLQDGGRISTDLFGLLAPASGSAGNIFVTASQSLDILGTSPANATSAIISSINISANGQGGNVTVNTGQLRLAKGGTISSQISGNANPAIAGKGTAGDITIRATDIQVSDPVIERFSQAPSGITVAVGRNSVGQGGKINIIADNLRVFNGGQITSSTDGNGTAGNISLQVKNIDVQGISQPLNNGQILPSSITAASTTNSNAGSINLVADRLNVLDDGQISVSNTGGGNSGNLLVNANQIKLAQRGSLLSEVSVGDQGNISLVADVLLMRYGSRINTNATGTATGGNISINAPIIIGLENSDITANAIEGSGGNINIQTQGLLGLKFRNQLTPDSDITASSQFGLSGTVEINNVGVDPNSGLVELPANVSDPSQKIASDCSANPGSSFVATGRGGIPQNPTQELRSDRTWVDTRDISAFHTKQQVQAQTPKSPEILVQATYWRRNAQGKIELIADKSSVNLSPSLTCTAVHKS